MKAVAYMKPGVALVDVPDAQKPPVDDWVRVKTAYVGICGTDAHIAAGHFDMMVPGVPFPMGHEVSGVIEELGPGATTKGLKVGDKVAFYYNYHCGKCHYCRSGQEHLCTAIESNLSMMTDFVYVKEQQVFKLPDSVSLLQGALAEPVSFCMHTVDMGNLQPGKTAIISGGGAIGLMVLQLAKRAGACKLTVVEPVAEKRKIALELGADHVIDPTAENAVEEVKKITGGLGFDAVFECSGAKSTIQPSLEYAAAGGTVVYVAMYAGQPAVVDLWDLFQRELHITAPHQSPYTWERTMNMLENLDLDVFTQCVYPKEQCAEAFDMQKTSTKTKVIIRMADDLG